MPAKQKGFIQSSYQPPESNTWKLSLERPWQGGAVGGVSVSAGVRDTIRPAGETDWVQYVKINKKKKIEHFSGLLIMLSERKIMLKSCKVGAGDQLASADHQAKSPAAPVQRQQAAFGD